MRNGRDRGIRINFFAGLIVFGFVLQWGMISAWGQASTNFSLKFHRDSTGWGYLNTTSQIASYYDNRVYVLKQSTDLISWQDSAVSHHGFFDFPLPESLGGERLFYKAFSFPLDSTNDWKNQVMFTSDSFVWRPPSTYAEEQVYWIKFIIRLDQPNRVIYQQGNRYLFHYDFVKNRIPSFQGISEPEFRQLSIHTNGQRILVGALLFPSPPFNRPYPFQIPEFGIQFLGSDAYPADFITRMFKLVKATVVSPPGTKALYIPSFEQTASAEANRHILAEHGIEVARTDRWFEDDQIYSYGWAYGRLKFFSGGEIAAAYADGRLLPTDILLTDNVPSDVPLVAGIIALSPSTPNSHVAILCANFGIPFVYLQGNEKQARARALVGEKVIIRIDITGLGRYNGTYPTAASVIDITGDLEPDLEAAIVALKNPPPLRIPARQRLGQISLSADTLLPSDIRYVGGKAAHFGLLRQAIPSNSPVAIAYSMDLWEDFMNQVLPSGRTLVDEIQTRLSRHNYPPNLPALTSDLAEIRDLIRKTARFTPAQKQSITNALGIFDPHKNIRFRSSSNVEDSEAFSGAGLYDSYSGCLLDDLDGDSSGPSHCDPTEAEERGVFRAMQKVYASFYNDNAVMARLRYGVDESQIGMGLLVHHSFPDEFEVANGVSTRAYSTRITVSQRGAVSISNPETNALPEITTFPPPSGLVQRSSLIPFGDYVLGSVEEYPRLRSLIEDVTSRFMSLVPARMNATLAFEFKQWTNGLIIKQVREVPTPPSTNLTPFLIAATNLFGVFQADYGDVFSNHRLKSRWSFQTKSLQINPAALEQTFYTNLTVQYLEEGQNKTLTGPPAAFPGFSHEIVGDTVIDRWSVGTVEPREFRLETMILREVSSNKSPLLTLADFVLTLTVAFPQPLPAIPQGYSGELIWTNRHTVRLKPPLERTDRSQLETRNFGNTNGVRIVSRFYWPKGGESVSAGGGLLSIAPLVEWVETTIAGITSRPIVLRGYFSQTCRPGPDHYLEEYLFEPGLEENLPSDLREELRAANVQLIYCTSSHSDGGPARIFQSDGTLR